MSVVKLGSNIASLSAQRRLAEGTSSLAQTFERLSSGLRINRASDDAAGLAISSSLKADTRVYTQAIRNINDGLSALSVAQGALTELSSIAVRQKELAEQAANGVYSLQQRRALNEEANALVDEYNRVIATTKFNGLGLLDNSISEGIRIQAGYGIDGSILFNINQELSRTVAADGLPPGNISQISNHEESFDIQSADVNGDGIADLMTANFGSGTGTSVSVLIGNGDGTFIAPVSYQTSSGPVTLALRDLNGDGKIDFITSSPYNNKIAVSFGNGDGTFLAASSYAATGVRFFEMKDFNNDGILDIAGNSNQGFEVLLGNSNGSFSSPITHNFGFAMNGLKTGDFNGDGNQDVLTFRNAAGDFYLHLGNGDGTFQRSTISSDGESIMSLFVGDFNIDGVLDIAAGSDSEDTISIYLGKGDGTFLARQTIQTNPLTFFVPGSMAGGDLNGDGLLDLLISSSSSDTTEFFLGQEDGTFIKYQTYEAFGAPSYNLMDVNGDGVLEMGIPIFQNNFYLVSFETQQSSTIQKLNINTVDGAREALGIVDRNLNRISAELGAIGSIQSRLEVALNNIFTMRENYEAAGARITDTDIAADSANLIRTNILQQAAAAVLAQANQQPALALRLLR